VEKSLYLNLGDTCVFEIRSTCGLPSFSLSATDSFDIQYIQFDDIDSTVAPQGSRLLQLTINPNIRRLNKTAYIYNRPSQNKYS
jgi:hypothetical protein